MIVAGISRLVGSSPSAYPKMFFGPGGLPLPGVNTPLPHSAPNAATSPFYKEPVSFESTGPASSIPMRIQARPVSSALMHPTLSTVRH